MKIAYSTILVFVVFINSIIAQTNYYDYYGDKFHSEKITVVKVSADTVTLKFYFQSSQQCACESSELFKLTKNSYGDFFTHPYDNNEKFIQANVYDGKVKSIVVKSSSDDPCCNINSGIYVVKPAPPSGSKITPALKILNAAPIRFLNFWGNFKNKMIIKDSIIDLIDFPFAIYCNYFNPGEVSKNEFKENEDGFSSFSHIYSYFKNNKLYMGKYVDGYMSESLINFFTSKFGNLENIYIISELGFYENEEGYKAYFKESNGTFKLIGFEGLEYRD